MNPIVRAMRANIARRDNWAQIRIGACALLLPPLTLGAAFYSMLAAPDEGAARPPGTAAKTEVVRPELRREARAVGPDPQPEALSMIANPDQPAPEPGVSASWPAPAEASRALLPRALVPPGQAFPQVPPPAAQTPAAHPPSAAAAPPSADGPAAPPAARKHARGETAAARRNAQRNEHAFSFKDWLQQLGIVPRNTRG